MSIKTLKTVVLSLMVAGCALFAPAADFYVDANYGDDTWNGKAATKGGIDPSTGLQIGPRKTLMGILEIANNSVAVIHAAPGHYNEGEYTGWQSAVYFARAALNAGQTLIATEGPEVTFIEGESDTSDTKIDEKGSGAKALRCLSLWGNSKVIGFTITGGRLRSKNDSGSDTMASRGAGILFVGNAYVANCIITNNYSANRGGGAYNSSDSNWQSAILLNCRVVNNGAANPCAGTMYCTHINCLFKDNTGHNHLGYGRALNCTIFDGVYNSTVSNSYIAAGADKGGSNKFGGCYYVTGKGEASSTYTGCTDNPESAYAFFADGTPAANSPLVDVISDTTFYDEKWPTDAKVAAYKAKDAVGGVRICGGKMDVGAVEYDWVRVPPAGLSIATDEQEGATKVSFTRTFPSKDAVLKSLTFAGETVDFDGFSDDYVFEKTVSGDVHDYAISVVYAKDEWYVATDGDDDGNDGFHKDSPFRTISKAMGRVSSGGTVHVAPGTYKDGDMGTVGGQLTTNRVVVKAGVTLVGDQGAAKTVIEGKWATVNPKQGCGTDAIRCVWLYAGSVLRGFTLRNGATVDTNDYGGGVRGENDSTGGNPSTVVECLVEDCRAYRGGGAIYGNYVRCHFRNNGSADSTFADLGEYSAIGYYGCVFEEGTATFGVYCPSVTEIVNCSLVNTRLLSTGSLKVYNSYVHSERGGITFYRCAVGKSDSGDPSYYEDGTVRGTDATGAKVGIDLATYRPLFGATTLRDKGNDEYLDLYPEKWRDQPDFAGGTRIVGGQVDLGAGEFTWEGQTGVGFTSEVIAAGDGLSRLKITPVHDSPKPCTGFSFNGKAYAFDGFDPIVTDDAVAGDPFAALVPTYVDRVADWYVSPTGDDGNLGYAADIPFKTFNTAMSKAQSGDVVHALAGVYDYGLMSTLHSTTNRVLVKAGVGLVADEGPEKTIIVGYKSQIPNSKGWGSDAVRCVGLSDGAYVQGFTLTGGAAAQAPAPNDQYGFCGGGVAAANEDGAAAVDCIITNNTAVRGGGSYNATCIRCRFKGNTASAWSNGTAGYYGSYIDCVVDGEGLNTSRLVLNCSVYSDPDKSLSGQILGISKGAAAQTINTILYDGYGTARYYSNCVFRANTSLTPDLKDQYCKAGQAEADLHDADYRPLKAEGSVLVDKGWRDAYDAFFPAKWAQFKTNRDACGGQRVYNAALDIGAGEFDWRPTYAGRLVGRRGTVVAASSDVTEGETGVALGGGESLTVDWTAPRSGEQSFAVSVSGEGTLTVLLDGAPLTATDGVYSFEAEAGSVSRLEISFEGTGLAEVLKFRGPPIGMKLLVK